MTLAEIAAHNARIVAAVHAIKRQMPRISARRIVAMLNDAGMTSSRGREWTQAALYRLLHRKRLRLTWFREWSIS